ncbi:MAG: DUF2071 domain-containing protein [Gemmatimonadota bacterium]|nr:DUF2071 domain-containing protein [Gemmatimonadota bacterium]
MLNVAVEPSLLTPSVPRGTTLDRWQGTTYVSLVGFLFDDTRVPGIPVPLHRTFQEVNLRFYVRRTLHDKVRRGVTFVRELVPRVAIATTARLLYNEPYRSLPMRHAFGPSGAEGMPRAVEYAWRTRKGRTSLRAEARGVRQQPEMDSHEAFITEHYWGYTRQRDGGTVEYQVTHPRWKVWSAEMAMITGDLEGVYGGELAAVLHGRPSSAFIADGSAVTVHAPSSMG